MLQQKITFRVGESELDMIKAMALSQGMTHSQLLRWLINTSKKSRQQDVRIIQLNTIAQLLRDAMERDGMQDHELIFQLKSAIETLKECYNKERGDDC